MSKSLSEAHGRRTRRMLALASVALCAWLSACEGDACVRQSDCVGGQTCHLGRCMVLVDAGDAAIDGAVDAGDAGDAGRDAGATDAGDAASTDANADTGMDDAGSIDAATTDTGSIDAGDVDAAMADAGDVDAGTDAGDVDTGM